MSPKCLILGAPKWAVMILKETKIDLDNTKKNNFLLTFAMQQKQVKEAMLVGIIVLLALPKNILSLLFLLLICYFNIKED